MRLTGLFITALFLSTQSYAKPLPKPPQQTPQTENWLLVGVESGLLKKSSVSGSEIANSGFELGLRVDWSHYFSKWIADVAIGWRSDQMETNTVEVSTKAFFNDLSARYRITDKISVGPSLTFLFGRDVSFSDVGTNSNDKSMAVFAGVRAMYDIFNSEESMLLRLGIDLDTDLNIADRQITAFRFIAEIGWPVGGSKKSKTTHKPVPVKIILQKPLKQKEPLKLNLMNAGVRFALGSGQLAGKSREIIYDLAAILTRYQGQWSNITIEGHTDRQGDYRSNIMLSRDRTESVKNVLVEYGISAKLVNTAGYGPDRPIDDRETEVAYAKNRRVELRITTNNATKKFLDSLRAVIEDKRDR